MNMKLPLLQGFPKLGAGLVLASGLATSAVAANVQPAQAGVVVSVGFGATSGYHWARWYDGYGWHRRWAPIGWVAPVAYGPAPRYIYPVRAVYARPYYWSGYHGGYGYPHRYYRR